MGKVCMWLIGNITFIENLIAISLQLLYVYHVGIMCMNKPFWEKLIGQNTKA
jgi:hypothetical protein